MPSLPPTEKCEDFLQNFVSEYSIDSTPKYMQMLVRSRPPFSPFPLFPPSMPPACASNLRATPLAGRLQQEIANRANRVLEIDLNDLQAVSAPTYLRFAFPRSQRTVSRAALVPSSELSAMLPPPTPLCSTRMMRSW